MKTMHIREVNISGRIGPIRWNQQKPSNLIGREQIEIPRVNPKLKDGAVPVFLPEHPSICSQSIASTKRRRVSPTSKDEEMFNEALTLSLASESEEKEKYQIYCFQDIQAKLPLLSMPKTWYLWYPDDHSLIYMLPLLTEHNIIVNTHILVSFDLSVGAYRNGEILSLPICSISDIRHLESILYKLKTRVHCTPSNS